MLTWMSALHLYLHLVHAGLCFLQPGEERGQIHFPQVLVHHTVRILARTEVHLATHLPDHRCFADHQRVGVLVQGPAIVDRIVHIHSGEVGQVARLDLQDVHQDDLPVVGRMERTATLGHSAAG
ncbi:MAG: hypothetical protein IPP33_01295 [Flavobacteriales bacterium]|nr:hypothetical protein [Flavobacteriales bacterium]